MFKDLKEKVNTMSEQMEVSHHRNRNYKNSMRILELKMTIFEFLNSLMLQLTLQKIKSIIREYYEQLSSNKSDNLNEMDKLLETCNLPKLTQEIENMNRPVISKEIKPVIKNHPTIKKPRTRRLTSEYDKTLKEYQSFLNSAKKLKRRE